MRTKMTSLTKLSPVSDSSRGKRASVQQCGSKSSFNQCPVTTKNESLAREVHPSTVIERNFTELRTLRNFEFKIEQIDSMRFFTVVRWGTLKPGFISRHHSLNPSCETRLHGNLSRRIHRANANSRRFCSYHNIDRKKDKNNLFVKRRRFLWHFRFLRFHFNFMNPFQVSPTHRSEKVGFRV
jgi:hypothetical protein